jgi:hypothetical protein
MTKPFDCARSIYEEIKVHVYGPLGSETPSCAEALSTATLIAELQARVEALEAATKPAESNYPAELDSSLVEHVAKGVGSASPWMHSHRDEARAAIREVAAWLRLHTDLTHGPLCALWIEQELKKTS